MARFPFLEGKKVSAPFYTYLYINVQWDNMRDQLVVWETFCFNTIEVSQKAIGKKGFIWMISNASIDFERLMYLVKIT